MRRVADRRGDHGRHCQTIAFTLRHPQRRAGEQAACDRLLGVTVSDDRYMEMRQERRTERARHGYKELDNNSENLDKLQAPAREEFALRRRMYEAADCCPIRIGGCRRD